VVGVDRVAPLKDDWREAIDAVAHARAWPTSRDVARLGAAVAQLSAAYNDPARARARARDAGAARLGFSFARDVPKAAAAVRELVACGAIEAHGSEPLPGGSFARSRRWGARGRSKPRWSTRTRRPSTLRRRSFALAQAAAGASSYGCGRWGSRRRPTSRPAVRAST
jgi:hypothetical protein